MMQGTCTPPRPSVVAPRHFSSLPSLPPAAGRRTRSKGLRSERLIAPSSAVLLDVSGELLPGDARTTDGSWADQYEVQVTAGQRLTVSCASNSLDTVLVAHAPGSDPVANDDFEGDRRRSQLELVAPASGPLKLTVTTYAHEAQGSYRITVTSGDVASSHPETAAQARWPSLTVGSRAQGALEEGDAVLPSGQVVDNYLLAGGTAENVEIAVQGSGGAPLLVITTPSGRLVQAAASAGGRAAAVVASPSPAPTASRSWAAPRDRAGPTRSPCRRRHRAPRPRRSSAPTTRTPPRRRARAPRPCRSAVPRTASWRPATRRCRRASSRIATRSR